MNGIVVNELDSFIKNSDLSVSSVRDKFRDLRSASLELRRSVRSSDLSFLTEGLYFEINEFSKVINKLNAYNSTLRSVLKSYQYNDQAVAAAVSRYASQKL